MKFYTSVFLLFCFSLATKKAEAQVEKVAPKVSLSSEAPTLRFEQLSIEDGMAQASANSIMQDKQGFIWIATQGGLHRYDGYGFKIFTSVPFDTTSLSDSWVWNASEASNGDLWVTTEGGGLNRLNPISGSSIHYRHDPKDSTSISSDRSFHAFEASNGDLWVSTFSYGLNRMRVGEDGKFSHYRYHPEDPNSISSDQVYWISEDDNGQIWVGSANGLNRIDPKTELITKYLYDSTFNLGYNQPQNVLGQYIPAGNQGTLWLATGNGLVRLNSKTSEHKRFLIEPNKGGINPLNFIHEVRPDPADPNVLWVGGPGTGIARFDMRTEQFTSYRKEARDKNSLRDNQVVSLFLDRTGMMWAGTVTEGINAFNPGAVNFKNIKNIPDDPSSLAPGIVWGVYEDGQGSLWVGSNVGAGGSFLTQFDAKTRKVKRHQHDPDNQSTLLPGTLRAFAEGENGQFWVAGAGGLSLFDRNTGKVTRFRQERTEKNRGRNVIFDLEPVLGDRNDLWIGSVGGLDRFNTRTQVFTRIPLSPDTTVFEPVVFAMLQDANATLWLGTSKGLLHIDSSGKVIVESAYDPQDKTKISGNSIQSIVERKSEPGILWLGMTDGAGLNRFDTKTGIATHITIKDGLPSNTLYGMLEDENGTLWMSTNNGISNYDPDTKQFRNYGLDDGLMALEFDQSAFTKGASGVFYFGNGLGVTAFEPKYLSTNSIPPQVVISDFKLFNKAVKVGPDSPLKEPLSKNPNITLNYNQNEISIDFVALHFANPEKNKYSYQLEGFDKDWIDADNKRSATYTNLSPGYYTFNVKAANADGVWNEKGASLQFTILPPWYKTWWAYILFIALFASTVFGFDRLQRRVISKKEGERAALREAELRAEAENKRRADTEELSKIGRAITSTLSISKIIETVYENVNALMDASVFGVGIYNKEKSRIDFPSTKEEGVMLPPYSNQLDEERWLSIWCFKNKKEIVISDFENEYDKYIKSYGNPLKGKTPNSIVYMPLMLQDQVIGVITTQSFKKDAYTEYHVNLLRNLANYAAIALDNASAYRKLDATLSELQSTQSQLIQSEKMASLGELTAGIAHEIQNPLNFVNNFAEVNKELLLEMNDEITTGNLNEVKIIARNIIDNEEKIIFHGKRADGIVKGMLQHSRSSSGVKEPTDINALADEYLRLAYHGLRAKDKSFNASMKTDFDEIVDKVKVVPQDMGRVILNLITNAFYAVTERKQQNSDGYEPTVTVSTKRRGKKIEIRVSDNGNGIPQNIVDKIFQPFFTTKPTGQGTGLGLSMSYDIITNAHGGELKVETKQGEGTTFIIILTE
ncbi:MAG: two-component regulator propeller domain-containing protein [Cytophagales bacterium]|nr:two-component regulator propeller domain-containing protein [Cytophagales bacterium]